MDKPAKRLTNPSSSPDRRNFYFYIRNVAIIISKYKIRLKKREAWSIVHHAAIAAPQEMRSKTLVLTLNLAKSKRSFLARIRDYRFLLQKVI